MHPQHHFPARAKHAQKAAPGRPGADGLTTLVSGLDTPVLVVHSVAWRISLYQRDDVSHPLRAELGCGTATLWAGAGCRREDREVPQLTGLPQRQLLMKCPHSTAPPYFSC